MRSIFVARQKNIDTLAELEITLDEVRSEILALSVADYCDGPLKDPVIKGDLWIFGKMIGTKEIYIKLKLWGDKRSSNLRVLSFHVAEERLEHPFNE